MGELDRLYRVDPTKFSAAARILHDVRYAGLYGYNTNNNNTNRGGGHGYPGSNASTSAATTTTTTGGYARAGHGGSSVGGYGGSSAAGAGAGPAGSGARTGGMSVSTGLPPPRFGGGGGGGGAGTTSYGGGGGYGSYGSTSTTSAGGIASASSSSTTTRWQNDEIPIKFRPSPFYRVEKSLSAPVTLYKAEQGDRKVASLSFGLTEVQRKLIDKARESPSNPQYEVRLYCTSDNNYSVGRPHASQFPAPVEFPQTCEIKLNGTTLNVNTKGIKKQPGTVPPVNLSSKKGPSVQTGTGQLNRVEVIYINTDKTTYYMVAYLVETTSIAKIVEKVKAGRTKPKEEVIQSIKDLNSDEEIAAGALGLSLRDPLSFVRIGTPVRSNTCNHVSCFDAETWFEMNQQTPTWGCPICSKTLKFEEMVVDGYFEEILRVCPSSVDSVTVEPDGTWRSDDNKYGTAPPRATKSNGASTGANNSPRGGSLGAAAAGTTNGWENRDGSVKPDVSGENGKGKGRADPPEALLLDSDDDDDDDADGQPLAKRQRVGVFAAPTSTQYANGTGQGSRGVSEVLDLTLTDSEDEAPPPPPPRPPPFSRTTSSMTTLTTTAAGSTNGTTHLGPRPGLSRNGSGTGTGTGAGTGVGMGDESGKTVAEVQRDIDAMNKRMSDEYGPDWRDRFGMTDP
ncbi:hypothetical protein JCM10212_004313 [Sporobolomyces blumeae]